MAIKFNQVTYRYESANNDFYDAISDISLSIEDKGEFITLIGETGSGKSTLVQHMNALIHPSEGEVLIYGIKVNKNTKKDKKEKLNPLRQKVGLVFQFPEYQLFEETVERDIIFGPKNFGMSEVQAKAIAKEVIVQVGLDESYLLRSPFNLSGGEKKRVSIAGILAMNPDILVLDEPTSGLDPKGRDDLLNLFLSIHEKLNKTVIIITHDMNIVYKYAKRVLVMNNSRLVFDGEPSVLFKKKNIEEWNLDLPDMLELQYNLENELGIKFSKNPNNIEDFLTEIKGAK
ncbi:energy-coupling factor transporter ATPase [Candidatus Izimaplasma bacterium ZiA1]|uniref:energy-coupling factor transporter ATPase n=1 Tax=Candidatus Izimoplasma sp. ZiA1 TaxID=2024899 RepID=UPI000BAA814A|nr:energy-coupling factor transporter ATPase [Candidatus Izimaplasma bacterium ZiA1]